MKRNYKILVLTSKDIKNPSAGGGTWELFRLCKRLVDRGHSVRVICGGFEGSRKHEYIQGIEVLRLGGFFSVYLHTLVRYLTSKELRSCHVIIEVMLHGFPFFATLFSRKPIIALCWHLPRMTYFTELRQRFRFLAGSLLAGLCLFLEDKIVPLMYRNVPVFTFSESSKRDLIQTGYNKVYVKDYALARAIIFNSIGTEEIRERAVTLRPSPVKNDFPLILYLGRLTKYKGVQDAIKAMTIVSKCLPDARLYIVGRGEYEFELKSLVRHLRLEGIVTFRGYVSFREKVEMLQKAHVLVMPSYREGFPTPIFEARMCGTPSLASNACGVGEYVRNGIDGLVYPATDWEKLAEQLVDVLEDDQVLRTLQENSIAWSRSFNWVKAEEDFVRMFEESLFELGQ